MQWLIEYAYALVARTHRYQWGGDDPIQGFDCSGLVLELLKAAGEIPHSQPKMSAQEIYNRYEKASHTSWTAGALAFYGQDATRVSHIAFCVNQYSMIEAGGGDHTTLDDAHAIAQNAFVRMRPIKYRADFLCVVKPNYSAIGMI